MTPEQLLDVRMAFSRQPHMDDTCGDLLNIERRCMLDRGHADDHAAGFGKGRQWWPQETDGVSALDKPRTTP